LLIVSVDRCSIQLSYRRSRPRFLGLPAGLYDRVDGRGGRNGSNAVQGTVGLSASDSSPSAAPGKPTMPARPYPAFPLTAHPAGFGCGISPPPVTLPDCTRQPAGMCGAADLRHEEPPLLTATFSPTALSVLTVMPLLTGR